MDCCTKKPKSSKDGGGKPRPKFLRWDKAAGLPKTVIKKPYSGRNKVFLLEDAMDIYIVRKCRVEMKEFSCASGARYKLPVMTADDIYSYIVNKPLTPLERENIQRKLEDYYAGGDKK